MSTNYKAIEFELYGALLRAREILASFADGGGVLERLDRIQAQIKSKKYNVAVVGEFRRGKSSLINALLGLPVLPSDVTPTTATINRITYGTEPEALVYFKDGAVKRIDDIAELSSYVTKVTEEREAVAKTVREAVVKYPIVICQNHVDIIDTPGLDDDEEMTAVTIGMLDDIDAAIVTVSALSPFSETERRFVARLIAHRGITNIVFVVTFIDEIDGDDYDRVFQGIKTRIYQMVTEEVAERHGGESWIVDKARRILDEMAIFGVSSKKALGSFAANDRKLLRQSRFIEFKEGLYAIVTAGQSVNMAEKAAMAVRDALAWLTRNHAEGNREALRKREEIARLRALARDLFTASHRRADKFLTAAKPEADAAGRLSREFAESAVRVFIRHLAGVRERRSAAVQTAIMSAGLEAADLIGVELNKAMENVGVVLRAAAERYLDEFSSLLSAAADLGVNGANVEAVRVKARGIVQNSLPELKVPAFKWAAPLWPRSPNLLDVNVIEHVKATLAQTLDAANAALGERVRLWRKGFFAAAAAMEREIPPELDDTLEDAEQCLAVEDRMSREKCAAQIAALTEIANDGEALLRRIRGEDADAQGTASC